MAKGNCYTVWTGRIPGVYDNWKECETQVKGFPGAQYKAFDTHEKALEASRQSYKEVITGKIKGLQKGQSVVHGIVCGDLQDEYNLVMGYV